MSESGPRKSYKKEINFSVCCLLLASLGILIFAGCTPRESAAKAVEAYLQALVEKDADRIANLSCAEWEGSAQADLDSLAAVTATIKDLKCQETRIEGNTASVSCAGKIVASYNGENQELDLAGKTYQALQEGGEWRICGYK